MDFRKGRCEILGYRPCGVVCFDLGEIGDVTNVVSGPGLVQVFVVHLTAGNGSDEVKGFEDGNAVRASASEVMDLTLSRGIDEVLHEGDDIA